MALLRNIETILKEKQRTSVFIAHRLKTISNSGKKYCKPEVLTIQIKLSCWIKGEWLKVEGTASCCSIMANMRRCGTNRGRRNIPLETPITE